MTAAKSSGLESVDKNGGFVFVAKSFGLVTADKSAPLVSVARMLALCLQPRVLAK